MMTETQRALTVAEAAHRAARAVTVDPSCEPRSAAHHLVGAWEALARAVCLDGHVPEDISAVGAWLPARLQAAIGPRAVAELGRGLPALQAERARPAWEPGGFPLARGEVEAHTWRLGQLLALARGEAAPRPKWHKQAAIAAAAAAVLLIAVRPWWTLTLQPWRGTYYARSDHSGKWQIRYDRQIDFDWGRDAPMDDVPADRFSVRWDSCLHLDAPTKAIFQSISDDGSRVYVDGDLVVLNRTRGKTQSRGGEAQLEAGVHHVRVDYSEFTGDAHVQVLASFDANDPPKPIPPSMLHAPRGPADEDDPCE
ncbi:PA14 domain-containing protein [Nannocystis punicea]|uniref:PA14 domain-containing protein n=1 Tax=Nannocystis punicea TaxID=2995304 RepID=A0ABY7GZG0_9BACT|nr:PA14 domain-containing protein [Nannocystis poenicansa]WAS92371.1 PA14 domain-containing protein [Nannocystis poenicansa]